LKIILSKFYLPLIFLCPSLLTGCIEAWFGHSSSYDQQVLDIQTVDLFNQRQPSRLTKKNWKGDWIFRRDRLEMIDAQLRNNRPDILVLQETMAKEGSPFEADKNILEAGVLADYSWRDFFVRDYDDTQEQQTLAFAGSPTVDLLAATAPGAEREFWALGSEGFLAVAAFEHEGQVVTVFNIQMPPQVDGEYLWYSFIQQRIEERMARRHECKKRIIVAGLMPGDQMSRRLSEFTKALQLKDVASGFCQIAANCFTATPMNDIYMATIGDESPSRLDRIYVHQSAIIYTSGRNFEDSDSSNRYAKEFGLPKLWPTQRFGWNSSIRLARCRDDEMVAVDSK
jgi:hypothetical protein